MHFAHRHRVPAVWTPAVAPPPQLVVEMDCTHPLARGLVAFFLMGYGGQLIDVAGGMPVSLVGNALAVSSGRGAAMDVFSGGYANVPDNASLALTGSFTLTGWVRVVDFVDNRALLGKTNAGIAHPFKWFLNITNGKPYLDRGNGASESLYIGGTAPALNVWQHLAVTFDTATDTQRHYLNGLANTSGVGSVVVTSANGTGSMRIGSRADGLMQMNGQMQAMRLYNRVLSADEISLEYQNPFGMLRPIWGGIHGTDPALAIAPLITSRIAPHWLWID